MMGTATGHASPLNESRRLQPTNFTESACRDRGHEELPGPGLAHGRESSRISIDEEMVSLFVHELRTPLAAITAFASLLLGDPSGNFSDRQTYHLNAVLRGATQMRNLVDGIFDVARSVSTDVSPELAPTDLGSLVAGMLDPISSLLAEKHQSLVFDTDSRSHCSPVDGALIGEALMAVISNASKYSPSGSNIGILMTQCNGRVEIAVCDKGPGIAADEHELIFELFYRGPDRQRDSEGLGVGLYVARRLVEAQAGTISVQPDTSAGATLCISLPALPGTSVLPGRGVQAGGDLGSVA